MGEFWTTGDSETWWTKTGWPSESSSRNLGNSRADPATSSWLPIIQPGHEKYRMCRPENPIVSACSNLWWEMVEKRELPLTQPMMFRNSGNVSNPTLTCLPMFRNSGNAGMCFFSTFGRQAEGNRNHWFHKDNLYPPPRLIHIKTNGVSIWQPKRFSGHFTDTEILFIPFLSHYLQCFIVTNGYHVGISQPSTVFPEVETCSQPNSGFRARRDSPTLQGRDLQGWWWPSRLTDGLVFMGY